MSPSFGWIKVDILDLFGLSLMEHNFYFAEI
jgi:hypothetical protein